MGAAQVQVLANEVARAIGHDGPIGTCRVDIEKPYVPTLFKADSPVRCLLAFRTERTGDEVLSLVGWPEDDGQVGMALYTRDGFQCYPTDTEECLIASSWERAERDPMGDFVAGFLTRLAAAPEGHFKAWVERCKAMNAERERAA